MILLCQRPVGATSLCWVEGGLRNLDFRASMSTPIPTKKPPSKSTALSASSGPPGSEKVTLLEERTSPTGSGPDNKKQQTDVRPFHCEVESKHAQLHQALAVGEGFWVPPTGNSSMSSSHSPGRVGHKPNTHFFLIFLGDSSSPRGEQPVFNNRH